MPVNRAAQSGAFFSKSEISLVVLFLFTLPLINPRVGSDGVGYYAYARSLLTEGGLNFEKDWPAGNVYRPRYTQTGHLDNLFTVGPAILWAPFLVTTHAGILALNRLGGNFRTDGFSLPYLIAMAAATALYGFLGLLLSFRLTRQYVEERWAFLATLGIWFASSLPVYMYFSPSWSHAHSAFAAALFLWYWHRTRSARTLLQWLVLGLLSGLMLDVYYPNAAFLLVPLLESLWAYRQAAPKPHSTTTRVHRLLLANVVYAVATVAAFTPTLVTRWIIYGSPFVSGYTPLRNWHWTHPQLWNVLFSSDHGLFSWTPILIPAVLGLLLFLGRQRELGAYLLVVALAFYYLIASHVWWDGVSSFGNRFFISLTPIFVLGLGIASQAFGRLWQDTRAGAARAYAITALLVVWNLAFIYQWGTHLIPQRGPISWEEMIYNQGRVVPTHIGHSLKNYLMGRREMPGSVEQRDEKELEAQRANENRAKHE